MAGYPKVFRDVIDLPEELQIVCGLSIEYPDEDDSVTAMRMPKHDWGKHITLFE